MSQIKKRGFKMNATVLCFCYATLLGFSNTNTMNNKLSLLNTIRNSVSQKQDLISYFKNLDPEKFSFDNKLKKSVKWLKGEIA